MSCRYALVAVAASSIRTQRDIWNPVCGFDHRHTHMPVAPKCRICDKILCTRLDLWPKGFWLGMRVTNCESHALITNDVMCPCELKHTPWTVNESLRPWNFCIDEKNVRMVYYRQYFIDCTVSWKRSARVDLPVLLSIVASTNSDKHVINTGTTWHEILRASHG